MPEADKTVESASRILLRPLELADDEWIYDLLSQPKVVEHTLFPLFNRENAAEYVRRSVELRAAEPRRQEDLAIVLRSSQVPVGLCGLVLRPEFEEAEAWYILDPMHWGTGLATEAATLLLRIGFGDHNLHRIWAWTLPANPASSRVLEKIGLRKEGYLKENLKIHGEWRDANLYAILETEWHER